MHSTLPFSVLSYFEMSVNWLLKDLKFKLGQIIRFLCIVDLKDDFLHRSIKYLSSITWLLCSQISCTFPPPHPRAPHSTPHPPLSQPPQGLFYLSWWINRLKICFSFCTWPKPWNFVYLIFKPYENLPLNRRDYLDGENTTKQMERS